MHMYIYIYIFFFFCFLNAVVSNSLATFLGFFWVNNLATVQSNNLATFFQNPLFYSVSVFCVHSFQGVVQNYCLEKLWFVKIGVFRKWVVAIFLGGRVWWVVVVIVAA